MPKPVFVKIPPGTFELPEEQQKAVTLQIADKFISEIRANTGSTDDSLVQGAQTYEELAIATALFPDGGSAEDCYCPLCFNDLQLRLVGVLKLMVASPSWWILIIKAEGERYVQFGVDGRGTITCECVSNSYLPATSKLSKKDEKLLVSLGWKRPSPPEQLNWSTIEPYPNTTTHVAVLALHTLLQVFGCRDNDVLQVKLFRCAAPEPPAEVTHAPGPGDTQGSSPSRTFVPYPLDVEEDEDESWLEPYFDDEFTNAYLDRPVLGPPPSGSENPGGNTDEQSE